MYPANSVIMTANWSNLPDCHLGGAGTQINTQLEMLLSSVLVRGWNMTQEVVVVVVVVWVVVVEWV